MDSCFSGTVQRDPVRDVRYRFIAPPRGEAQHCRQAAEAYCEGRDASVAKFVDEKIVALGGAKLEPEHLREHVKDWVKQAIHRYEKRHFGFATLRGNSVLIAGCRSDQTSADAHFPEGYHGALSYYLLRSLRDGSAKSFGEIAARPSSGRASREAHHGRARPPDRD